MDKKVAKKILDERYKIFLKNPSAVNYLLLEHCMRIYQDVVKNQPNK